MGMDPSESSTLSTMRIRTELRALTVALPAMELNARSNSTGTSPKVTTELSQLTTEPTQSSTPAQKSLDMQSLRIYGSSPDRKIPPPGSTSMTSRQSLRESSQTTISAECTTLSRVAHASITKTIPNEKLP